MLRLRRVLDAERIMVKSVGYLLGCTSETVQNKLEGKTEFTYNEAKKIKGILPMYDLDYLMSEEISPHSDRK